MRRGGWCAALVLVACGGTPKAAPVAQVPMAPPPATRPPDLPPITHAASAREAEAAARVKKMLAKVVAVRGLAPTRDVPGVILSRDELMAQVKKHIIAEVPAADIREEGETYQLLGLIPWKYDYEQGTFDMLHSQLAGYYEPADGTMYMAADLEGDGAYLTLAHELDHALQDQHWDLKKRSKYAPGHSDAQLAQSCLAEGDATSTMLDVMLQPTGKTAVDVPDSMLDSSMLASMSAGSGSSAPPFMMTSLVAPYAEGMLFVNTLRRQGGWDAVDRAWDRTPSTTEQILHVDKFDQGEAALDVADPTFAALGPGWTGSNADTLGELTLRLVLGQWLGETQGNALAAHWGGDRALVVSAHDKAAFVWHIRYDADAPSQPSAVLKALERVLDAAVVREPTFVCSERAELGPLAVARKGHDVLILAGPANTPSGAWTSAGTCALARKWAAELLAQKRKV